MGAQFGKNCYIAGFGDEEEPRSPVDESLVGLFEILPENRNFDFFQLGYPELLFHGEHDIEDLSEEVRVLDDPYHVLPIQVSVLRQLCGSIM